MNHGGNDDPVVPDDSPTSVYNRDPFRDVAAGSIADPLAADAPTIANAPSSGAGAAPPEALGHSAEIQSDPSQMIGTILDGKYRIDKLIGIGGMGAVYAAKNTSVNRKVAVKILWKEISENADSVQRFHNEAKIVNSVESGGIVDVLDMGSLPDGAPFLVMEHLEGESLAHRIRRGEPLSLEAAVEIVGSVLETLSAVHASQVVHRDLKPGNVFLVKHADDSGVKAVKLLDFGVSKIWSESSRGLDLTRTGTVLGSPYYMAPEQFYEARSVDRRADLYSVGVMLYELVTGRRPFVADNYNALMFAITRAEPTSPLELKPDLPKGLAAVILKAISKQPDQRYDSAVELLEALRPFAPDPARSFLDESPFKDRRSSKGINVSAKWLWILIVSLSLAVLLVISAILVVLLRSG